MQKQHDCLGFGAIAGKVHAEALSTLAILPRHKARELVEDGRRPRRRSS